MTTRRTTSQFTKERLARLSIAILCAFLLFSSVASGQRFPPFDSYYPSWSSVSVLPNARDPRRVEAQVRFRWGDPGEESAGVSVGFPGNAALEIELHFRSRGFVMPRNGEDWQIDPDVVNVGHNLPGVVYVDPWNYAAPGTDLRSRQRSGETVFAQCFGFEATLLASLREGLHGSLLPPSFRNAVAWTQAAILFSSRVPEDPDGNFSLGVLNASRLIRGRMYEIYYPMYVADPVVYARSVRDMGNRSVPTAAFSQFALRFQRIRNTCTFAPAQGISLATTYCPYFIGAPSAGICSEVREQAPDDENTGTIMARLCAPTGEVSSTPATDEVSRGAGFLRDPEVCFDNDRDGHFAYSPDAGSRAYGTRVSDCDDDRPNVFRRLAEANCSDRLDDDCDGLIDCDDSDCVGLACSYCSASARCPENATCDLNTHSCVARASMDAGARSDVVSDMGARDVLSDVTFAGETDRYDAGRTDAATHNDATVDAGLNDSGPAVSGIPYPPAPVLNARIPSDVTYHRTYNFAGLDTCATCADNPSDPYRACVRPGFELDIERRATSTETSMWEARNYVCALNSAGGYYDCFKNYNCIWNMDPLTGAACSYPLDGEMPGVTPTCQALPSIGIRMSIPAGVPGSYGYNMAVWPYEPSRPAFRVGSNVYVYAQFYLPTGQDVTARPGVDCTPSADPDRDVGGVHVPATTGSGRWHEVLIPLMATVGDFTTIRENLQNCNGWLQCMNSGIWPPNAGDARGGSCIVSRLEFAGYRDFCDLDRYDIELAVDDCAGCTLSHNLRAGSDWITSERGTLSGSTMTWRFRGSEVQHNCQLNRQFNVQLSSGDWMIDDRWAPVEPTHGTAILIRRRARWRYMNGSTVVSSVDVGCSMATPNHDNTGRTTLGHHGQMRITGGRVIATGRPDLPCEGP